LRSERSNKEAEVRKAFSTTLVALVAMTVAVPPAGAKAVTYVTAPDCRHLRIEPHKILFACADGGYYADHLNWGRWKVKSAAGRGVFHFNDCDPDCAGGTFHKRRGKIVLSRRVHCHEQNKYSFDKAHITYDKPYKGERENTIKGIGCPL
jgi:hypothetical protein